MVGKSVTQSQNGHKTRPLAFGCLRNLERVGLSGLVHSQSYLEIFAPTTSLRDNEYCFFALNAFCVLFFVGLLRLHI
jgi:hypothetical protein